MKPLADSVRNGDDAFLAALSDEGQLKHLVDRIYQEKGTIVSIVPRKESLEDLFMEEVKELRA